NKWKSIAGRKHNRHEDDKLDSMKVSILNCAGSFLQETLLQPTFSTIDKIVEDQHEE
ncbi:24648_t:CDS:1, partial [Racocetra persica]